MWRLFVSKCDFPSSVHFCRKIWFTHMLFGHFPLFMEINSLSGRRAPSEGWRRLAKVSEGCVRRLAKASEGFLRRLAKASEG